MPIHHKNFHSDIPAKYVNCMYNVQNYEIVYIHHAGTCCRLNFTDERRFFLLLYIRYSLVSRSSIVHLQYGLNINNLCYGYRYDEAKPFSAKSLKGALGIAI